MHVHTSSPWPLPIQLLPPLPACACAGKYRKLEHVHVFLTTALWSVWAYIWLFLVYRCVAGAGLPAKCPGAPEGAWQMQGGALSAKALLQAGPSLPLPVPMGAWPPLLRVPPPPALALSPHCCEPSGTSSSPHR